MAKQTAADSSVVMALSELVQMEQARIEGDRAREEQRIAEVRAEAERALAATREQERVRLERAAREAQVAEAEARLRVEADRERDQRIAAMRAELARVESERERLRDDLAARATAREPSRPGGWALAFGLSSLVAASLAGLLVMQQATHDVVLPAPAPAAIAIAPSPTPPASPIVAPVAAPVAPVELAAAPVAVSVPRGHRHHTERAGDETASQSHGTDLVGLGDDDGSDDVLGGLSPEHSLHH